MKKIILDIGNVVAKVDNQKYFANILKQYHADDQLCQKICDNPMWLKLDKGEVTYEQAINYYKQCFPKDERVIDILFEMWPQAMKVSEQAIETIKWLKENNYKVYYLTNINQYCLDYIKDHNDFLSLGDGYVASCECHLAKPDADIYTHLFNKFDLHPEECLYLDDNIDNIQMGNHLGMETILVKNIEKAMQLLKEKLHD